MFKGKKHSQFSGSASLNRGLVLLVLIVTLCFVVSAFSQTNTGNATEEKIVPELAPYQGPSASDVDTTTLIGKTMCGYQGWFRAVGDGVANAWTHWSKDPQKITADTLTVEMWPDMSEYPATDKFLVPGLKDSKGQPVYLFSSIRPETEDLHFKWMKQYGIDGVFVQRFLTDINKSNDLNSTGALAYCRNAANKYGRAFAITYDLTGTNPDEVYDKMTSDWKFLVDKMQITKDKRYLHHNEKPVLMIFGFYPDRFDADHAMKIINFFKNDPKYGATLIGSGMWNWRIDVKETDNPGWYKAFRSFDGYIPWNSANYSVSPGYGGIKKATVDYWYDDMKEARKNNMLYIPVIFPGFSWQNLKKDPTSFIDRRDGGFIWEQILYAMAIRPDGLYVGMFDEVDEGTAIFKVTDNPPAGLHMVTYGKMKTDWFLRLVGYATKMFRGEAAVTPELPGGVLDKMVIK